MENKENVVIENEIAESQPAQKKQTRRRTTSSVPKAELKPQKPKAPKKRVITPVDLNELVQVVSCSYGTVNYISPTGRNVRWENFGDVAWMTVQDLMDMRNHQRTFFERQWICLEGENAKAVMDYLQISQYYKDIASLDGFDEIFSHEPEEIAGIVATLSEGAKDAIISRAYDKIQSGEIDSIKMIKALEDAFGYDLTTPQ